MLRHRDIPLAVPIAASPWLDGPVSALSCFGFIGFRCFFVQSRLSGCRLSGCSGGEFPWRLGKCYIRQGTRRTPKPRTSPTTPAPVPQTYLRTEFRYMTGGWCLERGEVPRQKLDGQRWVRWGAGHRRVNREVLDTQRGLQMTEGDRERGLWGQNQGGVKLAMRQIIMRSCASDGGGQAH